MTGHDAQLLKGVLSLLLLHLVGDREDYGYSLVVRLQQQGFSDLGEGTVYPALTRMQTQGLLSSRLVRSTSGPARKYYRITSAGEREVGRALSAWRHLNASVDRIIPAATLDLTDHSRSPR